MISRVRATDLVISSLALRSCRLASWTAFASLSHEKRQIDDDNPVYGEQQRLKDRLKKRIACAHDERVGAERHAQQRRANSWPNACKQAGHQDRRKEQHEWSTCSGKGDKPYPEGEHTPYHGDGEEIPKYDVLEQDVEGKLHIITRVMRDAHRAR